MREDTFSRRTFLTAVSLATLAAGSTASASGAKKGGGPNDAARRLCYKKTPQRDLFAHLYFPADWKPTDRRVAIVFYFGGGWTQGNPSQFATQAEHFARRGMVAVCPEYRVKGRDGVEPETCVEDAKSAVRWLRVNQQALAIDPARIVASGGSAGGHLAACTALTPDIVGKGEDPAVSSQTCAMVLFNPVVSVIGAERVHGDFTEKLLSPILYLKAGGPPAVLFYGAKDKLLAAGKEFVRRSKELGNRADLHVTPGQDHGFFTEPPFRGQTQQVADEFLVSLGLLNAEASKPRKKRG